MIRNPFKFSHLYFYKGFSLKKKLLKVNIWHFSQFGTISLFKNIKNTCRGVLFLVKLQVLHSASPEVFLTFLNEASCPKSQTKFICVKKKRYALCILSIVFFEQKIHLVKYARERVFSNPYFLVLQILFLIGDNTGQRRPVFSHILHRGQHLNQIFC